MGFFLLYYFFVTATKKESVRLTPKRKINIVHRSFITFVKTLTNFVNTCGVTFSETIRQHKKSI